MSFKDALRNFVPYGIIHQRQERQRLLNEAMRINIQPPYFEGYEPRLYNKQGEPMRTFYLQDSLSEYDYSFVRNGHTNYIHWDRHNYGLPVHFYTHNHILKTKNTAKKKFAYFIESEAILGCDYEILDKQPELAQDFNAIFTTCERHLEKFPNAKFVPAGGVWYGKPVGGGEIDQFAFEKKSKNISIISSDKSMCKLHDLRKDMALRLEKDNSVDTFGTFNGGPAVKIADTLTDYRYSIVFENNITSYYFTEKILNCFAAQTIPIYIGATKINEFFNSDGIIQVTPEQLENNLHNILSQCTIQDYNDRKQAILDNFERVKQYSIIEDWMYSKYKDLF